MTYVNVDTLFGTSKVTMLDAPVQVEEKTISFDPGRTTGLVIALPNFAHWIAAEVVELPIIWRVLWSYNPRAILFERFHGDNPAANDEALDVRGIVKLYRALMVKPKIPPVIHWQPREAKSEGGIASSECLRANGLWVPGKGHDRNAIQHLIWHLIKRCGEDSLIQWTKPTAQAVEPNKS
jgi:hypothetical protein